VVDNLLKGKRENLHPAAHFHQVDIRDAEALGRVFSVEQPQAIVHQAALADVRGSLVDPTGYAATNILGTLNLLEAARSSGMVRKFLFASTGGAVYGDPVELPATEKCPVGPLDPYGASKLACEYYIATYHHNYGLDYCLLRYANVYGPRQDPEGEAGVVAIFTGRMLRGQQAIIYGDGKQVRDFVYVGDIARANLAALERGTGIYNIGTGVPTDINTIFGELAEATRYTLAEAHGAAKLGEVRSTYLDVSLSRRELGWAPSVALSEGLAQTVAYFRERMGAG
jgi:UDP-glucose 4-epimerase